MLNSSEICCIVVTYNPDEALEQLLKIIKNQVDQIIIVDNCSNINCYRFIEKHEHEDRLKIIKNPANYGIAKALNQGIAMAIELGYSWAITFDQDTKPFNDIINSIVEVFEGCTDKNNIGAIGVNSIDIDNQKYQNTDESTKFTIREYLITSGTMISLKIFSEIGGFDDDYFIDNVDIEYSLKLRSFGKLLLITNKCGMLHKPGHTISKKLFCWKIESSNHKPIRRFYMSRNNFILTKKYFFLYPRFTLKLNYFYLISLIKMVIIEKDIKNKLISTLKGVRDGFFYKKLI